MKEGAGLTSQQEPGSLGPGFVRGQNAMLGAAPGEAAMGGAAKPPELGRRRSPARAHRFSELEGALKRHLSAIDTMLGSLTLPRRSAFHQLAIPADRPQSVQAVEGSKRASRWEAGEQAASEEGPDEPARPAGVAPELALDRPQRRKLYWRADRAGAPATAERKPGNWPRAWPRLILTPARLGQFGLLAFLAGGMAVLMLQSPEPPKSPAIAQREAKAPALKVEPVEVRTVGAISLAAPADAVKPSPARPAGNGEASSNVGLAALAPAPERPAAAPAAPVPPARPALRATLAPAKESTPPAGNPVPRAGTSTARIQSAVNMRAKPDNDAPTLTIIPAGASVEFFGCNFWCEVGFAGMRGFVYKSFIGEPARAANLPAQAKPDGAAAAR